MKSWPLIALLGASSLCGVAHADNAPSAVKPRRDPQEAAQKNREPQGKAPKVRTWVTVVTDPRKVPPLPGRRPFDAAQGRPGSDEVLRPGAESKAQTQAGAGQDDQARDRAEAKEERRELLRELRRERLERERLERERAERARTKAER